jgi:hypothetical protein
MNSPNFASRHQPMRASRCSLVSTLSVWLVCAFAGGSNAASAMSKSSFFMALSNFTTNHTHWPKPAQSEKGTLII